MLFIFALGLMKEGAGSLAPLLRNHLQVDNTVDSMGFGWLTAYLIQSGSPVAAAAISLLSADVFTPLQAYMAVAGSRLGAGLMVLQLGIIYVLQGHEHRTALSAGILSLLLTGSIMIVSLPMGIIFLRSGWLHGISLPMLEGLAGGLDQAMKPLVTPLAAWLPGWAVFLVGVGVVTVSFQLIDSALSKLDLKQTTLGQANRLIYRPPIMFLLGFLVTLVTLSVSISLGILVPLSARGYMRRENIIPYVMGANISTLIDTLVAAMLLGDSRGVAIVFSHMAAATVVSLLVIVFAYSAYERSVSRLLGWIVRKRLHFAIFLGLMIITPLILVFL